MHLESASPDTGKPTTDDVVCILIAAAFLAAAFNAPAICRFLGVFQ